MQKLLLPHAGPGGFCSIGQALTHNKTVTRLSFLTPDEIHEDGAGADVNFNSACLFLRLLGELKALKERSCFFDWWNEDAEREGSSLNMFLLTA